MKKWEEIDISKVSSYIRSDPAKFQSIMKDAIGWCNKVKRQIRKNISDNLETVGFDVIHDSRKGCRIVERSIQVACTNWHPSYWPALQELRNIVK